MFNTRTKKSLTFSLFISFFNFSSSRFVCSNTMCDALERYEQLSPTLKESLSCILEFLKACEKIKINHLPQAQTIANKVYFAKKGTTPSKKFVNFLEGIYHNFDKENDAYLDEHNKKFKEITGRFNQPSEEDEKILLRTFLDFVIKVSSSLGIMFSDLKQELENPDLSLPELLGKLKIVIKKFDFQLSECSISIELDNEVNVDNTIYWLCNEHDGKMTWFLKNIKTFGLPAICFLMTAFPSHSERGLLTIAEFLINFHPGIEPLKDKTQIKLLGLIKQQENFVFPSWIPLAGSKEITKNQLIRASGIGLGLMFLSKEAFNEWVAPKLEEQKKINTRTSQYKDFLSSKKDKQDKLTAEILKHSFKEKGTLSLLEKKKIKENPYIFMLCSYLQNPLPAKGLFVRPIYLVGPPGTGKTHMAKLIAKLTGARCVVPPKEVTIKEISDYFDFARTHAQEKCFILLEELPELLKKKGMDHALRQEIDPDSNLISGSTKFSNVAVLAIGNDANLSEALKDRFEIIYCGQPPLQERIQHFENQFTNASFKLEPPLSIAYMAEKSAGWNHRQIEKLFSHCSMLALQRPINNILQSDFDEYVEKQKNLAALIEEGLSKKEKEEETQTLPSPLEKIKFPPVLNLPEHTTLTTSAMPKPR